MSTLDFQQILASPILAYEEGLEFFAGKGMLNETLRKLIEDLEGHGIEYAVIGAVALNQHGYQRFTSDIDLLMTKDGLDKFRTQLLGFGYMPKFEGARKTFRSTAKNIPIEIITAGEYPGDGKPKPVQFPDPQDAFIVINGIKTITLEMLITLKLASGMTNAGRLKDLADVQELIKIRSLDAGFAEKLDPFVREKFLDLYQGAMQSNDTEE
jgi:hypothetical protein